MRLRIAEINQHAVAHKPGDEAVEPGDDFRDGAVISSDDLAQILGIEARRECGRANQVAKHHCKLPTFGLGLRRYNGGCGSHGYVGRGRSELRDSVNQPAAVADRLYAELA